MVGATLMRYILLDVAFEGYLTDIDADALCQTCRGLRSEDWLVVSPVIHAENGHCASSSSAGPERI